MKLNSVGISAWQCYHKHLYTHTHNLNGQSLNIKISNYENRENIDSYLIPENKVELWFRILERRAYL